MPDELWRMVVSMMFDEGVVSLAPQDPKAFLKEVYGMPEALVNLTAYMPFRNMALDTELFSLIRLAKVLRGRLYLAFEERMVLKLKCAVLPRSELTVNYLNDEFFQNHRIDIDRRRKCFSAVANELFYERELRVLNVLISRVSDDILKGWWMTVKDIPFILHAVTTSTALRLCRLSQGAQLAWRMASICLAGGFGDVEHLLKSDPAFINDLESALVSIASEQSCTDYFARDRELKCKPLLDWLSERNHDTRYVRLLYSIRGPGGSCANVEYDAIIRELSRDNTRVYRLVLAVFCAQKQKLLEKLLPLVLKCDAHQLESVTTHRNIGAMFPFDEYMKLMNRVVKNNMYGFDYHKHLIMVQICKTIPGAHFDDDWVNKFPAWSRLVVLATIGDEDKFEAAIRGDINCVLKVQLAMGVIIDLVDDPVPFVGIILRMRVDLMCSYTLGQKRFLRSLLLSEGREDVFELVSTCEIILDTKFLEALLEEEDLREAFEEKRGRLRICVCMSYFSEKCVSNITELLDILQVQVCIDAFSLLDANGAALEAHTVADRVKKLGVACTLETLADYAQRPGFLACVALFHTNTDFEVCMEPRYEKFKKLSPLHFRAFELLRQWSYLDRVGFVKSCNCCVVLMFFAAKIDKATWAVAGEKCTATIEHVAAEMSMSLVFSSEREMERFKSEVLSVLDVADRVQCRVESSERGCVV